MPDPGAAAILRDLRTNSTVLKQTEEWVRTRIYGMEDDELRWLRDQYVIAYRNIMESLPTAYDEDGRPALVQRARLLAVVEREINALMDKLGERFDPAFEDAYRKGAYGRAWILDQMTVSDYLTSTPPVIPTEAIRAVLLNGFIGGNDWVDLERGEFLARLRRSLTQSLILGEGMRKAQARLIAEMGIQPGQTNGFKGSMWRSLITVRTEIMRASNLGALAIYEQNADILAGWEWVSARDERVCKICIPLDGEVFKFDDFRQVPPSGSHPGCRCTPVPVLKDEELMERIAGPRETYCDWAARRGIVVDGGLCDQRGADAHALNTTRA